MLQEKPLDHHAFTPQDLYTVPSNLLLPPLDTSLKADLDKSAYDKDMRYLKWRTRAIRFGERAVASALVVVAAATTAYMHDVAANKLAADKAQPSVAQAYPALEGADDKATIYYDGFNTYGARYFAKTVQESVQEIFPGKGLAVQYNNAVIDSQNIIDTIDEEVAAHPEIQSADVIVHSAGTVLGVDYVVETTKNSWLPIETATIIAGPTGFETLTEDTQDQLSTAEDWSDVPYVEYSTLFRYILEMHFYEKNLQRNPINTINGINTRFMNGNVTSNRFLASQMKSVSNADVVSKLKETDNAKFRTIYNVAWLEDDQVVDGKAAADQICKIVTEMGHICNTFIVENPNGGHGGYWTDEGKAALDRLFKEIAEVNTPQLEKERARYALTLYTYMQEQDLAFHQ